MYVDIIYIYNFFCQSLLYLDERQGARVTFKSIYCISRFYVIIIIIMLCGWSKRETDKEKDRQRWKERNK